MPPASPARPRARRRHPGNFCVERSRDVHASRAEIQSGTPRWILPTGAAIAATPSLDAAGTIFVGSRDDRLYAVASEGRVLWNVAFPADVDSGVAISPVGTLVVGCDDGVLRALR